MTSFFKAWNEYCDLSIEKFLVTWLTLKMTSEYFNGSFLKVILGNFSVYKLKLMKGMARIIFKCIILSHSFDRL